MKAPVYHRQRMLLILLDQAGGGLSKVDFQKLLFLYCEESDTRFYSFVPHRFGCYSFQASHDLQNLEAAGWVSSTPKSLQLRRHLDSEKWANEHPEKQKLKIWLSSNRLRGKKLIQKTYRDHPWTAIRSEIKSELLSSAELQQVEDSHAYDLSTEKTLFTIGYEGRQFEEYANLLLKHNVTVLCDVRRNPISRKFGFSKQKLSSLLPDLGIEYCHIPELGITSEERRNLKSEREFDQLFKKYRKGIVTKQSHLNTISRLVEDKKKVALTCFEKSASSCHRHCITEHLALHEQAQVKHI